MGLFDKIKTIIHKKEDYKFLTEISEYDLDTSSASYIPPEVKNNEVLFFLHEKSPFIFKNERYFQDWKNQYIKKSHNYFYNYALKEHPDQYYLDFLSFARQLNLVLSKRKMKIDDWYPIFHHLILKDELANFKILFYFHYFQANKNKVSKMLISQTNLNIIYLLASALKAHNIVDFLINTEFDEFKNDILLNILKEVKKWQFRDKELNETLSTYTPCENIDINIKEGEALYVSALNKNNELIQVLAKRSDLRIDFNNYDVINQIIKTGNFNMLKLLHEKFILPKEILAPYDVAINNYASHMLSSSNKENVEMIFVYLVDKNLINLSNSDYLLQAVNNNLAIATSVLLKKGLRFQNPSDINHFFTLNTQIKFDFVNTLINKKALLINEFLETPIILDCLIDNYIKTIHIKSNTPLRDPKTLEILLESIPIHYKAERLSKEKLITYMNLIHEKNLTTYFQYVLSKIEKILLEENSGKKEDSTEKKKITKI